MVGVTDVVAVTEVVVEIESDGVGVFEIDEFTIENVVNGSNVV